HSSVILVQRTGENILASHRGRLSFLASLLLPPIRSVVAIRWSIALVSVALPRSISLPGRRPPSTLNSTNDSDHFCIELPTLSPALTWVLRPMRLTPTCLIFWNGGYEGRARDHLSG